MSNRTVSLSPGSTLNCACVPNFCEDHAIQTVPTGFFVDPPVGPTMPVMDTVIQLAKKKITELEQQNDDSKTNQYDLFVPNMKKKNAILFELKKMNLEEISPKEAFDYLYVLKENLKKLE